MSTLDHITFLPSKASKYFKTCSHQFILHISYRFFANFSSKVLIITIKFSILKYQCIWHDLEYH